METRVRRLIRRVLPRGGYGQLPYIEPRLLSFLAKTLRLPSGANTVDIEDLRRARQKDTVFVMGSGYSINSISESQWAHIAHTGDVFSFNYFHKGEFLPIRYHACGEIGGAPSYGTVLLSRRHRKAIKLYYRHVFSNPLYANAIYFLRYTINLRGVPATTATWALYFSRAFKGKRLCLYSIDHYIKDVGPPSESISSISHHNATLSDAINISYLLGYREIILVGVDLYDRRYFWLAENQTRDGDTKRGKSYLDVHSTTDLIVRTMDMWNTYLGEKGVRLYVYNPRSLLRAVLPLYNAHERGVESGKS